MSHSPAPVPSKTDRNKALVRQMFAEMDATAGSGVTEKWQLTAA